jgi:hypothetical protein
MELQRSQSDRRYAKMSFVVFSEADVKTCGTTNTEKRRPGNPWASAAG